jgi:hypothetical protein
MSRYFFHISGSDPFHDVEGMDLPDDRAAWREAKRLVRDIENNLEPGGDWHLNVVDGVGSVFVLSVKSRRAR